MLNDRQDLRSRLEFSSSEEWRAYVENNVPLKERPYVLECGLTALYRRFYEVHGIHVPEAITTFIQESSALPEPDRTKELRSANAALFSGMTQALFASLPHPEPPTIDAREDVAIPLLFARLEQENQFFALWCAYKRSERKRLPLPTWETYVRALLAEEESGALNFAVAMSTLGELMQQLSVQNKAISLVLANRIRNLHREKQGQERDLATSTVLQELLEVITPCTSA